MCRTPPSGSTAVICTAHAAPLDVPGAVARSDEPIFLSGEHRIAEDRGVVGGIDPIQTAGDHKTTTAAVIALAVVAVERPGRRAAAEDIQSCEGRDQCECAAFHGGPPRIAQDTDLIVLSSGWRLQRGTAERTWAWLAAGAT